MTTPKRTRRKPGMPVVHKVTAALRDLVADFCRRHHGELHPTCGERVTTPEGVNGATWAVPTRLGAWYVHEPCDPCTPLVSINTRFTDPDRARPVVAGTVDGSSMNPYSGKWNHNWCVEPPVDDPVKLAHELMDAFEHLAAVIFPEPV